MRNVISAVMIAAAVAIATVTYTTATGPVTAAQCYDINPNPIITDCTRYNPPIVDLYGSLPYDTVEVYQNCVKARCMCTGAATNTSIDTAGIYCNSTGWEESGFTTCNTFNHCFKNFWFCVNDALIARYNADTTQLSASEADLATDIIDHGRIPGERFRTTDVYRSCRLKMCAAAASRQNCGLVTCLPNYTQCNEYILPPPLPYTHQLCTQGCRAVLLMMALTIAVVSFSVCCVACCPAVVIVSEPVIKRESPDGEKGGHNGKDDAASYVSGNSPTHTNHNSHRSSDPAKNGPDQDHPQQRQPVQQTNDPF